MNAMIKMGPSEFNEDVFRKIKALIKSLGDAEVTIAISNTDEKKFRKETNKEYWNRLDKSIQDIEQGKGIVFTMNELEQYIHKIPS